MLKRVEADVCNKQLKEKCNCLMTLVSSTIVSDGECFKIVGREQNGTKLKG